MWLINAALAPKSPWTFLTKFCYTLDEHDPEDPFKLMPVKLYARVYVRVWQENRLLFVEKSRQIMITWLTNALFMWDFLFSIGRRIYYQSKKQDDANAILERSRILYENLQKIGFPDLPHIDKNGDRIGTDSELKISKQKCLIQAIPSGGDIVRSHTWSGGFGDEFAFQLELQKAFDAAQPSIKGGGRVNYVSTPNGKNFHYYMMYGIDPNSGQSLGPNILDSNMVPNRLYTPEQLLRMDDRQFYSIPLDVLVACVPGMRYWKTANGTPCLRIHYTADPAKNPATEEGKKWYEAERVGIPETTWEREYEISYEAFKGKRVIGNFNRRVFVDKCQYDSEEPLRLSFDFGTSVGVCLFGQLRRIPGYNVKQFQFLHECVLERSNTIELADYVLDVLRTKFLRSWENNNIITYCDVAGHQSSFDVKDPTLNTSIKILQKKGFSPIAKKMSVPDSVEKVQTIFMMVAPDGQPVILIDPACEYLIKCLMGGWRFPDTGNFREGYPLKDGECEHGGDATRYMLGNIYGVNDMLGRTKRIARTAPIISKYTGRKIGTRVVSGGRRPVNRLRGVHA